MESLNSNSQERELHPLQQMQDKAKESCMCVYSKKDAILKLFKLANQERYEHVSPKVTSSQDGKVYKMAKRDYAWLMISRCSRSHSYIQVKGTSLSLKSKSTTPYSQEKEKKSASTRTKTFIAFAALFDQDVQTFTCSMLLNLDQLEKQLDKEEFQETGSMDAFRVPKTQFQMFINFRYYFDDDDGLMIRKYFPAYTRTEVRQFHDTLIQHMEFVKKSIDERAHHKREYDSRINERQMQSKEGKVDSSKALDDSLVVTKCSKTKSDKQDTSSRPEKATHAKDANINSVNKK
ncbi:hypothetical protein Tco_0616209 [Tanacetum coccineum]